MASLIKMRSYPLQLLKPNRFVKFSFLPNTISRIIGSSCSWCYNMNTTCATCTAVERSLHTSSLKKHMAEDSTTRSLTVLKNLKDLRSTPLPALCLGVAGLLPFVAAPAYISLSGVYIGSIAHAQLAYGACILSFLGGVRWGLTLPEDSLVTPDWYNIGYSVMPALIAWPALLVSDSLGMVAVVTGLAFTMYMDMTMIGYPSWFKGLRFLLSIVAILSLWTTFIYGINGTDGSDTAVKDG